MRKKLDKVARARSFPAASPGWSGGCAGRCTRGSPGLHHSTLGTMRVSLRSSRRRRRRRGLERLFHPPFKPPKTNNFAPFPPKFRIKHGKINENNLRPCFPADPLRPSCDREAFSAEAGCARHHQADILDPIGPQIRSHGTARRACCLLVFCSCLSLFSFKALPHSHHLRAPPPPPPSLPFALVLAVPVLVVGTRDFVNYMLFFSLLLLLISAPAKRLDIRHRSGRRTITRMMGVRICCREAITR